MTGYTPKYGIPYALADDQPVRWPDTSQEIAVRLEALIDSALADTGGPVLAPHAAPFANQTIASQGSVTLPWANFGVGSQAPTTLVSAVIYNGGSSHGLILGGYASGGITVRNVGGGSITTSAGCTVTIWVLE